jgi:hypothetical protein
MTQVRHRVSGWLMPFVLRIAQSAMLLRAPKLT